MKLSTVLLWALPATLAAADEDVRTTKTKECVGRIYHTLRQNPDARSFCSSFLRTTVARTFTGPTVTTTVRTTAAVSTSTVTKTRTKTTVIYVRSTPYTTTTVTSFSNAAVSCASSAGFFSGSVVPPAHVKKDMHDDLDKRTQTKPPYSTPSVFSGEPSATISSMCSCLHVNVRTKTRGRTSIVGSTATVTKTIVPQRVVTTTVQSTLVVTTTITNVKPTSTQTATSIQPVPTTFNGLRWYAYPNSYDFTSGTPNIDVTIFNSPNYIANAYVYNPPSVAGGSNSSGKCTLPNSNTVLNCAQNTVVMQGYLYAPEAGTYTLTTGGSDASSVDNYVGLWTGNPAYDNYNNNNADFIAIRADHSTIQQGGSATYQLLEGQLLPVTIIYMNGGYGGAFMLQIVEPDGTVNSDTSNFWIPACANSNPFSP